MFPKVPQSSQPQSLGFPSYPLSLGPPPGPLKEASHQRSAREVTKSPMVPQSPREAKHSGRSAIRGRSLDMICRWEAVKASPGLGLENSHIFCLLKVIFYYVPW